MVARRKKINRKSERDLLEDAQAILITVCMDLDEVSLRIRQAIRRSTLVFDVLNPALERLDLLDGEIKQVQLNLNGAWKEGQKKKWR